MSEDSTVAGGIDTSKDTLDAAIFGQPRTHCVANSEVGWRGLEAWFRQSGVGRIGIEATGGYERGVVRHLRAAGFIVAVVQPLQVRAFAKLQLRRAKTDRIDAALIAACTQMLKSEDRTAPDARLELLVGPLTYIEQIEEDIARLRTRLEHTSDTRLNAMIQADIASLSKRRLAELKLLRVALCAHDDLGKRYRLVLSVRGIGARTALAIVIRMPELGQVSREQAAALAGLAPFTRQSGKLVGQAHIGGGRARLRRSLFAAALAACLHWNPALQALYRRLLARGKSHTSAVACARKLLIYANTVVTRGTPWTSREATPTGQAEEAAALA
jgi:transposase